jgi:hypothetical protein
MMTLFITLCDRSIGPLPGSANQPANRANQTSRSTVHATDPVHVPSALTPTNPPPPPLRTSTLHADAPNHQPHTT